MNISSGFHLRCAHVLSRGPSVLRTRLRRHVRGNTRCFFSGVNVLDSLVEGSGLSASGGMTGGRFRSHFSIFSRSIGLGRHLLGCRYDTIFAIASCLGGGTRFVLLSRVNRNTSSDTNCNSNEGTEGSGGSGRPGRPGVPAGRIDFGLCRRNVAISRVTTRHNFAGNAVVNRLASCMGRKGIKLHTLVSDTRRGGVHRFVRTRPRVRRFDRVGRTLKANVSCCRVGLVHSLVRRRWESSSRRWVVVFFCVS